MKILMVSPTIRARDGGPARGVLEIAAAHTLLGHEVAIVTMVFPGDQLAEPFERAKRAGVKIRAVPKRKLDRFRFSLPFLRQAITEARGADLVSCHGFYQWPAVVAWLVALVRRANLVIQPHGVFSLYHEQDSRLAKKLFRIAVGNRIIERAQRIFAATEDEAHDIRFVLPTYPGEVVITPLGVNTCKDATLPTFNSTPRVMFLARIAPKKRLDRLVEAVVALREGGLDVHLDICGDFDNDYAQELRRSTVAGREGVHWHGHVSGDQRKKIERAAWLYCLPSERENFGQSITEAMSCGLPVMVTATCGAAALVSSANAGWVLSPEQADDLAPLLRDVLKDPAELQRRGIRGQTYVARNLSWERTAAMW